MPAATTTMRHPTRCAPLRESRGILTGLVLFLLSGLVGGCNLDQLSGSNLPPDVADPGQTHNSIGAMATYRGALLQLRTAFAGDPNSFVPVSGLLTDELRAGDVGLIGSVTANQLIDSRTLLEFTSSGADKLTPAPIVALYGNLQKARAQAMEARGELRTYDPDSTAQIAELEAVQAYAEVLLADMFCSGIPLTTLEFGGDYTLVGGSSTADVYQHAVALFDSATALAGSGSQAGRGRVTSLAAVGKGRALLALGQYPEAGSAVAGVTDGFLYAFAFNSAVSPGTTSTFTNQNYFAQTFVVVGNTKVSLTLVDVEGGNGLPFLSSGDPRTPWATNGSNSNGVALFSPTRWTGVSPIVMASAVEARLIQAEAQLQANNQSWLTTLNALRTTCTTTAGCATPAPAGTGGIAGLPPLSDPGTSDKRVDLMFRERAFWLFLTGLRQGDMRRLIRQYKRDGSVVYPTGSYPGAYGAYGSDVTAPIPGSERISNPQFTYCINREG